MDRHHLQAMRIVAYDSAEARSTHFDMLRTQVLQRMDAAGRQTVAVTSPRSGCGKTVSAINLALSMARQSEQAVLLVDLDLRLAPGAPISETDRAIQAAQRATTGIGSVDVSYSVAGTGNRLDANPVDAGENTGTARPEAL